jgi:hypothetical protein
MLMSRFTVSPLAVADLGYYQCFTMIERIAENRSAGHDPLLCFRASHVRFVFNDYAQEWMDFAMQGPWMPVVE